METKYYIRTTHNLDGTYKGKDEEKDKVWQYADIGFIGHMLHPTKYLSIEEIKLEVDKYNKDYNERDIPIQNIEASLIILCKFGLAEELK